MLTREPEVDTFPQQRLLCIARQSGITEPSTCAVMLQLLTTCRIVRQKMQRVMQPSGMSEVRFLTLVTLYALDPAPSCPADLAYHAEITRSAMTDTLDQMEKQGWIRRERFKTDRRVVHVHLTAQGRKVTWFAIRAFFKAAEHFSKSLKPGHQTAFTEVCRLFRGSAGAA